VDILKKIDNLLITVAWDVDPNSFGKLKSLGLKSVRLFSLLLWAARDEELGMRAMSLVYTTILSIVPLLAVSFSLLKAFGVQTNLEFLLYDVLAPLGERGVDLSMKIITFVENINVHVLGAAGLSILLYTLVSNISKLEAALNFIWSVQDTRDIADKFIKYFSVLLLGPVLIFSAIGLTGSMLNSGVVHRVITMQPFGSLMYFLGKLLPYLIVWAAFTFIYKSLPNTRVHLKPAAAGGLFAALLWETAGWAFAVFIVSSSKYSLIYSGFAVAILSIIWLDLSWLILLIGARVSFYFQYPILFSAAGVPYVMNDELRERLAIAVMYLIGSNFYWNRERWTFDSLIKRVGLPVNPFKDILAILEKEGLITTTGVNGGYLPARALDTIMVKDIVDAVRTPRDAYGILKERTLSIRSVDEVMEKIDNSIAIAAGKTSLKDLILAGE
jgi:membrane protein